MNRRLGQLLLVVGLVSLLIGAWAGAQYRTATARRLFFVEPFGMAAGPEGRVYVGVDRREVHAYTASGQPVAAWTVVPDRARFRLRVDDAGRIEVALEGADERLVYDGEGKLLARHAERAAFEGFGSERDHGVTTPAGARFEIDEDGLVHAAPGERTLLVAVPQAPLAWLGARPIRPLTALLFAGTMGLIGGAVLTASTQRAD